MNTWRSKWPRRAGPMLLALGVLALVFSALYLAASAEGLGTRFAALYPWVFLGAGGAVLLLALALAIAGRLLKLRRQLRAGEPGARLSRRLLVLMLALSVPPVLLVFAFSARFVGASVDSWLRANTLSGPSSGAATPMRFSAAWLAPASESAQPRAKAFRRRRMKLCRHPVWWKVRQLVKAGGSGRNRLERR